MRESAVLPIALVLLAVGVVGCELIADIFRAGVLVGFLVVVAVVVLIIWIISALLR